VRSIPRVQAAARRSVQEQQQEQEQEQPWLAVPYSMQSQPAGQHRHREPVSWSVVRWESVTASYWCVEREQVGYLLWNDDRRRRRGGGSWLVRERGTNGGL